MRVYNTYVLYYREIRTKGNAAADKTVTDSRTGGGAVTAAGCRVAKWKVAGDAAGGCDCCCCLIKSTGLPPSRDRLRGLLMGGTVADGSCCWLNIHRKYHDIARAYCARARGVHPSYYPTGIINNNDCITEEVEEDGTCIAHQRTRTEVDVQIVVINGGYCVCVCVVYVPREREGQ